MVDQGRDMVTMFLMAGSRANELRSSRSITERMGSHMITTSMANEPAVTLENPINRTLVWDDASHRRCVFSRVSTWLWSDRSVVDLKPHYNLRCPSQGPIEQRKNRRSCIVWCEDWMRRARSCRGEYAMSRLSKFGHGMWYPETPMLPVFRWTDSVFLHSASAANYSTVKEAKCCLHVNAILYTVYIKTIAEAISRSALYLKLLRSISRNCAAFDYFMWAIR